MPAHAPTANFALYWTCFNLHCCAAWIVAVSNYCVFDLGMFLCSVHSGRFYKSSCFAEGAWIGTLYPGLSGLDELATSDFSSVGAANVEHDALWVLLFHRVLLVDVGADHSHCVVATLCYPAVMVELLIELRCHPAPLGVLEAQFMIAHAFTVPRC